MVRRTRKRRPRCPAPLGVVRLAGLRPQPRRPGGDSWPTSRCRRLRPSGEPRSERRATGDGVTDPVVQTFCPILTTLPPGSTMLNSRISQGWSRTSVTVRAGEVVAVLVHAESGRSPERHRRREVRRLQDRHGAHESLAPRGESVDAISADGDVGPVGELHQIGLGKRASAARAFLIWFRRAGHAPASTHWRSTRSIGSNNRHPT